MRWLVRHSHKRRQRIGSGNKDDDTLRCWRGGWGEGPPAPQAPDRKERGWLGGTENRREGKVEARWTVWDGLVGRVSLGCGLEGSVLTPLTPGVSDYIRGICLQGCRGQTEGDRLWISWFAYQRHTSAWILYLWELTSPWRGRLFPVRRFFFRMSKHHNIQETLNIYNRLL